MPVSVFFGFMLLIMGHYYLPWSTSALSFTALCGYSCGIGMGLANSAVNLIPSQYYPSLLTHLDAKMYHYNLLFTLNFFDHIASFGIVFGIMFGGYFCSNPDPKAYDFTLVALTLAVSISAYFLVAGLACLPVAMVAGHTPPSFKRTEKLVVRGSKPKTRTTTKEGSEKTMEEKKTKAENNKTEEIDEKTKVVNEMVEELNDKTKDTTANQAKNTNKTKSMGEDQKLSSTEEESDIISSAPMRESCWTYMTTWVYLFYIMFMGTVTATFFAYLPFELLQNGSDMRAIDEVFNVFAVAFVLTMIVTALIYTFCQYHLSPLAVCFIPCGLHFCVLRWYLEQEDLMNG